MTQLTRILPLAALLTLGGMAHAQATDEAPAADDGAMEQPEAGTADATGEAVSPEINALPLGEASAGAEGQPELFLKEKHGDWDITCVKLENDAESCNMQQLLSDQNDNPVAQISVVPLPANAKPRAAGVEVATPLETLLSGDVAISVDGGNATRYRFTFCSPQACFARFAFTEAEVARFRAGNKATVAIVPLAAPDQTAEIEVSLSGFTAAFKVLQDSAPRQ